MFRIEKLKKEEGSRMRSENKELEYSLEKLRQQRIEAENKLQLMVWFLFSLPLRFSLIFIFIKFFVDLEVLTSKGFA